HHYSFPSIFIYGHQASGKSHVMQVLLKELEVTAGPDTRMLRPTKASVCGVRLTELLPSLQLPHATVSCVECLYAALLFEQVLLSFFGCDAASLLPRSPSLSDFVRVYRQQRFQSPARQTRYIVMEKAEHLRDADANVLPAFLRLQELVEDNVTVVLLSAIVWDKFRPNTGCFEPLLLHFPDYSKGELHQILSRDKHPSYSAELYSSYITILLGVFYSVCRDLRELRHLAALNFSKFCEPLLEGRAKETDAHKLWRNIEPHLKKAMRTVYLREVSRSVRSHSRGAALLLQVPVDRRLPGLLQPRAHGQTLLPEGARLRNAGAGADADLTRLLSQQHHGRIKKTNFSKKNEKFNGQCVQTSNHLLGPKPFPLDRLLAIFYSVVDSRVAPSASVFSQISSLVTLQLLTKVSHDDQLDAPKYKCSVSMDFICAVSRTVNFDIIKYLYDFL
ncbi:unnamed protein product, partial [Tetraodon nigroviridis]